MKKIILIFSFLLCIFNTNAQVDHGGSFYCDCHTVSYHKDGQPFKIFNDSLLIACPAVIYNSITSQFYYEWHIKSLKYGYYKNDTIINKLEHEKLDSGLTAGILWGSFYYDEIDTIAKTFKYGFIDDWGWSTNIVNGIKFHFSYTNTNKKTIKYIDIYFNIKNDVGDICPILYTNNNIGHFRCTGPVEYGFPGSWNWDDHVEYYTSGDASHLYFTKIVLTFMDNTKYTLIKEIAYKEYVDF